MDRFRASAAAYVLGVLDEPQRDSFAEHLRSGCSRCAEEVDHHRHATVQLAGGIPPVSPSAEVRMQLLDLAEAPSMPLDLAAYDWQELGPGIKVHVVREDPARHFRSVLIWARPGARHGRHRHGGDENILVLAGALRDDRATYGPGDVCRSRPGSVHSEEVAGEADCICYVTYYGDLEML